MEKTVAIDYTVPYILDLKQRSPGVKYEPYEVREAAENLKNNKYTPMRTSRETKIMNSFPWLQSHLV
jgi:hypothetical protein